MDLGTLNNGTDNPFGEMDMLSMSNFGFGKNVRTEETNILYSSKVCYEKL